MFCVEPGHRALAAEFKAHPFGPHSGELQRLLNLLRARPELGRYALLKVSPYREWALLRLGAARGGRMEIVEGVLYHSAEEAEWDVFKRRWHESTGKPLDVD